jgi:UDP-N-acetylglucosamine 1-carboxyvinyltransferase
VVIGKTALQGEYLDTPDVRIGLAMLAAALCAEGESIIDRAELIERHFEHGVDKLIKLGAQMQVEH